MNLVPLKLAAATLGLSTGYVRALCRARRVPGAVFDGRRWLVPDGAQVIHKMSGLYVTAGDSVSAEARKQAELQQRMQRLAAALAAADDASPADGGDGNG